MNLAHIIFLDFDGPLFSDRMMFLKENNGSDIDKIRRLNLSPMVTYWKMDSFAVEVLNEFYHLRPYFFVISNSWSDGNNKESIMELMTVNGLEAPLHKDWKINNSISKNLAISNWLEKNKYADYLVLDDYDSGDSFLTGKLNYLDNKKIVLVDEKNGLLIEDYYKIKSIILNWK
jgi:hypothetical protein